MAALQTGDNVIIAQDITQTHSVFRCQLCLIFLARLRENLEKIVAPRCGVSKYGTEIVYALIWHAEKLRDWIFQISIKCVQQM